VSRENPLAMRRFGATSTPWRRGGLRLAPRQAAPLRELDLRRLPGCRRHLEEWLLPEAQQTGQKVPGEPPHGDIVNLDRVVVSLSLDR